MLARDAILDPEALQQWAVSMYELHIPWRHARDFVKRCRKKPIRLSEYNLRLSLKWRLIPFASDVPPFPRPTANPNRISYPMDNYARQTGVTMTSLSVGGNEAGPSMTIAIRRLEEIGGHIGETQMLIDMGAIIGPQRATPASVAQIQAESKQLNQ